MTTYGLRKQMTDPITEKRSVFRKKSKLPKILLGIFTVAWAILAIKPVRRKDWLLENLLVVVIIPILRFLYKKKVLSDLSFIFLFVFGIFHIIGSHFTYSKVPIGNFLGDGRNHYDRIVHFIFGALLTLPAFEIIKSNFRKSDQWTHATSIGAIFFFGVLYEFMEWFTAMIIDPDAADDFVGAQGDKYDAYKDLGMKLIGSLLCSFFIFRIYRKQQFLIE